MPHIGKGTEFRYGPLRGKVLHQVEMFVAPGKPYKKIDNYRVEIEGSPIEYLSKRQILECLKNGK